MGRNLNLADLLELGTRRAMIQGFRRFLDSSSRVLAHSKTQWVKTALVEIHIVC